MRGYDRWLTTDTSAERQMEEADQIIEHGMPYFQDRPWGRDPATGRVVWACEFCGELLECSKHCYTQYDEDPISLDNGAY